MAGAWPHLVHTAACGRPSHPPSCVWRGNSFSRAGVPWGPHSVVGALASWPTRVLLAGGRGARCQHFQTPRLQRARVRRACLSPCELKPWGPAQAWHLGGLGH